MVIDPARPADGHLVAAEGHDLTAYGLQQLAAGLALCSREGVWSWTGITEGDRTPGG